MQHTDFPALYLAADSASTNAQQSLLRYHRLNNLLLIAGAGVAVWSDLSRLLAILSAALFLGSLFLYIYGRQTDLQAKWYQARALAESVKTVTWRFVMNAEPFHKPVEGNALDAFRNLLNELLSDNKDIGKSLAGDWSANDQVTAEMIRIRNETFEEKSSIYLKMRIDEQRKWYARKSCENRQESRKWFIILCVLYGIVILFLLIRIAFPDTKYLPIEALAVAASCAIGWTELKRFNELASAYGLTLHEIGIIKIRFASVSDLEALSRFVGDAENAFSREHTQWAARRDQAP